MPVKARTEAMQSCRCSGKSYPGVRLGEKGASNPLRNVGFSF